MIYDLPDPAEAVDQADLFDSVPLVEIQDFSLDHPDSPSLGCATHMALVMTQTCDLVQLRANRVVVAQVMSAAELVQTAIVKAADVRGPIRAGRVWGVYFLPNSSRLNLPEMIVDFRHLQSVPLSVLDQLRAAGQRKARLRSPYREHLAKHFGDTYSRIGLPMPYETD